MKTKFNYLLVLLLTVPLVFFSCGSDDDKDPVLISGFTLENKDGAAAEFALTTEDKVTQEALGLVVTVKPGDASNKSYTITGDDVVSVSQTGGVYYFEALKAGSATITVKAADAGGKTATFTITVSDKVIPVTSITLANSEGEAAEFTLAAGEVKTLEELGLVVTVGPDDATDKSYTIAGDEVVEVTEVDGTFSFKALQAGEATITVTSGNVTQTFTIIGVPQIEQLIYDPEVWTLSGNSEQTTGTDGGGYIALFDGDLSTFWHSLKTRQVPPYVIDINLGAEKEIDHVIVKRRVYNEAVWPVSKVIVVEVSTDGVEYTNAISHDFGDFSKTNLDTDLAFEFKFEQLVKAQYIKVTVQDVNINSGSKHASLSEVEIYGVR